MNQEQINQLTRTIQFAGGSNDVKLLETHISWVILAGNYAYKIKKPVKTTFLDFSTPARRKHFCQEEIKLNRRLTKNIYLKVVPVIYKDNELYLNKASGEIIDHAVKMNRMNTTKQMDKLLKEDKVTLQDINRLADKIAWFHKNAEVIKDGFSLNRLKDDFIDIESVKELAGNLSSGFVKTIDRAIKYTDTLLNQQAGYLEDRFTKGFTRDCHGDLHSKNIILEDDPIIFDCIEFNDDLRQIDILNEISFFCMDLELNGKHDLSFQFYHQYLDHLNLIENTESKRLFNYYKCYRANVRAKVMIMDAEQSKDKEKRKLLLQESEKYFRLMEGYLNNAQLK